MTADAGIDVTAQLSLAIGELTAEIRAQNRDRQRLAQALRQGPITAAAMTLAGGAGVIDLPDLLAVKTGYYWSVRRLTLTGWTAGSVTVALNATAALGGEPVAPFPTPAVFTYGRGELLMHPGDRLVISATGITGSVILDGAADIFEQWYLPYYLG